MRGCPRRAAQRPLPSMMTATCRGRRDQSTCASSDSSRDPLLTMSVKLASIRGLFPNGLTEAPSTTLSLPPHLNGKPLQGAKFDAESSKFKAQSLELNLQVAPVESKQAKST